MVLFAVLFRWFPFVSAIQAILLVREINRDCFGAFDPFYTVLTSLEVPPSLNKMDVLNEYFGRFGPAPQFPSNSKD